jgi:hypothetical protein
VLLHPTLAVSTGMAVVSLFVAMQKAKSASSAMKS